MMMMHLTEDAMIVTIEVAVAVAVDDEKEEDLLDYLDVVLVAN